jgi:O-methyltransferase involved in polyketide biosynthesis
VDCERKAASSGTPEGATDYIDADVRDPAKIVRGATRTLDLTRPVAIMMLGILPFIGDDDEARAIVGGLLEAVPSGSYLAVAHSTSVVTGVAMEEAVRRWNEVGSARYHLRTPEQIGRLFDGLELLEPGVVSCPRWRPEPLDFDTLADMTSSAPSYASREAASNRHDDRFTAAG